MIRTIRSLGSYFRKARHVEACVRDHSMGERRQPVLPYDQLAAGQRIGAEDAEQRLPDHVLVDAVCEAPLRLCHTVIVTNSVWGWTVGGEGDQSASMGGAARSGAVVAGGSPVGRRARFAAAVRSGRHTGPSSDLRARKCNPRGASSGRVRRMEAEDRRCRGSSC